MDQPQKTLIGYFGLLSVCLAGFWIMAVLAGGPLVVFGRIGVPLAVGIVAGSLLALTWAWMDHHGRNQRERAGNIGMGFVMAAAGFALIVPAVFGEDARLALIVGGLGLVLALVPYAWYRQTTGHQ